MPKKEEDVFEELLAAGLIGAGLGLLLSKGKGGGALLGALAGAAVLASVKASEEAKKAELPLVVEENDVIYEVLPDGTKRVVKRLAKPGKNYPKNFTIK